MAYDYSGKTAIVTGASSGIGEATAMLLAKKGTHVVLAARRAERLEAIVARIEKEGGSARAFPCDVTSRTDNDRLVQVTLAERGAVDILVLNAGRGNTTSIENTDDGTLLSIFQLNVFSLYYLTRAALPSMRAQNSGRIVTVASMAGKLGLPFMNAYVAAKHAAVGFSNALRLELLETGIEASVLLPAAVATEWAMATEGGSMGELFMRSMPRAKEIAKERGIKGRSGGILTAEDIGKAILGVIENPVPEVYTHEGTYDAFVESARDRAAGERSATPMALAMREVYPTLSKESA